MNVAIHGQEFTVDDHPDNKEFWGWVNGSRWETHSFVLLDKYLSPEHTFVDVGAWIGPLSMYAGRVAKRTVAIEPDPVAFARLTENCLPPIELHRLAIMNSRGRVKLGSGYLGASTTRMNPHAGGGIGAWEPGQEFEIECMPLREFIAEQNIENPFIKIDVEGAEEEILKDETLFQELNAPLFISLHPFWWRAPETTWKQVESLSSNFITLNAHTLGAVHSMTTLQDALFLPK